MEENQFAHEASLPAFDREPLLTVVRGGTVYAPEPVGQQDLLIAAGRIVAMGPGLEVSVGRGPLREVDANGMTVVPAFIDGHVHILGGGGQGGGHTRNRDLVMTQASMAGTATLVGCLGMDYATRHVISLLAKARGLEAEGLSTYITTGGYGVPTPTLTGSIITDLTIVDKVVGIGEVAVSDHRSSCPTHDELARLAAEGRVGGLYGTKAGVVILHMGEGRGGLDPVRKLVATTDIPVSQFLPTHINRTRALWDESVEFARSGGTIDITAGIAPSRGFPAALKPSDAVVEALDRGIPADRVTMTSDANGNMPFYDEQGRLDRIVVQSMRDLFDEIRDLVCTNGLPLETALLPVTRNVARLFRLPAKGQLRRGFDGDVLVLTPEFKIHTVISRGMVLVQEGQPRFKGFFE